MSAPMTEQGPSTVTEPIDLDPCPYCGGTSDVQVTPNNLPKVRGWSCTPCGGQWWITVVNPRPWLDHLTATVELAAARSVLRELITLADQAPMLTDEQLRSQLLTLAVRAEPRSHAAHPDLRLAAGRARPPTRLPTASRSQIHPQLRCHAGQAAQWIRICTCSPRRRPRPRVPVVTGGRLIAAEGLTVSAPHSKTERPMQNPLRI